MITTVTDYFEALSADEIIQETAVKWSDSDLLDVVGLFEELDDSARTTAVIELILYSPDNSSDMVEYSHLYLDLIENIHIPEKNYAKAAYWAMAALAYEAQHDNDPETFRAYQYTLIEIYLRQGAVEAGLQLATRLLQIDPLDRWTAEIIGRVGVEVGLPDLAAASLKRALEIELFGKPDDAGQLQERYERKIEAITAVSPPPVISPETIAQFNDALALPLSPTDNEPARYLPPITQLFSQGETLDDTLRQAILAQGKVLVPELIQVAFEEDYWETAVNRHALTLLRQIHKTEPTLDALAPWLEQATDPHWPQLLCRHIGKIGGVTTPHLQALIANTNIDTYIRSHAAENLLARLETMPQQRPDIIEFFRNLLTREEAYEANEELFIALLIATITDTDAKELYPEIKQVFDEDRLDPTITDLSYIHDEWDMTPLPPTEIREDGLYVTLTCKKCQRTRRHFVQHVTVDLSTLSADLEDQNVSYDPYIMDRPIICPKCGSIDQYKTDPITSLRLTMGNNPENIFARLMGEEPATTSTPDPFVSQVRPQAFGQDMHPLVALNKYKQLALNHPKDAEPHWRMGNILRMIRRDEQAKEAYKRGIALDPTEMYAWYSLATTEHDLGNFGEAKTLYEKVMTSISPMQMMRDEELMDIAMSAAEGLKALKNDLPSPYAQEYRMPKEEKKLSRRERRAEAKRLRKLNKKKRR